MTDEYEKVPEDNPMWLTDEMVERRNAEARQQPRSRFKPWAEVVAMLRRRFGERPQ